MKKLTVHHIHHVPKCLSCHKAILMITGQWLQCLIVILLLRDVGTLCGVDVYLYVDDVYKCLRPVWFVLYPSCLSQIGALCVSWMYLNLSYNLCNLFRCLISKRRSSIGQTLTKIKHKVKWMIKVLKTRNFSSYMHSFLSTAKIFEKIRLHMVFTLFVNILKKLF